MSTKYTIIKGKTGKSKKVNVEGVKKVLYKKDGNRKMYVVSKGKMMQLTKYKEMKKKQKSKNAKEKKSKSKSKSKLNKKGGSYQRGGMTQQQRREYAEAVKQHRAQKQRKEELKLRTPEGRAVPLTFNPTPEELQQLERAYNDANHNVLAAQGALNMSRTHGDSEEVISTMKDMLKKREQTRDTAHAIMQNAWRGNRRL